MYDYTQLQFRADDTIFGTTFFTLTGFHGAHVAGGVIFMFVVLVRALGGQFSARPTMKPSRPARSTGTSSTSSGFALFTTLYIVAVNHRRDTLRGRKHSMDHQNNAHGEHDEIHLPDPSIWPLAVGVATLLLGAALDFLGAKQRQRLRGADARRCRGGNPLRGVRLGVRRRPDARKGRGGGARRHQANPLHPGDDVRRPGGTIRGGPGLGILAQLEERDNALRDLGGFQDLRIIATPGSAGPSQVLIETTWSDREGLATYEETRQTMLDLVAANPEQVLPGSVQVFDMEVVRDTKDVTFRFGKGAAFTVVAGLMVGGFMIGAGLNLFADDSEGGGSGGGETVTPPPANPFSVVMTDNKFDKTAITAGPNAEIVISATNNGASPHNIAFYDRQGGTALPGQTGTAFVKLNGGESGTNTFTTPGAGEYFFQCDFHPDTMTGTFSVVEGGPTGPAPLHLHPPAVEKSPLAACR